MSDVAQSRPPFDSAQGGLSKAERPPRRPWKIVAKVALSLVVAAVAVVALAPMLIPESMVRQQVTTALAQRLGRPVTVESARFGWTTGLRIEGLVIPAGEGSETPLARAAKVSVRFSTMESLSAAFGGEPPMDSLRVEGLEVWLVYAGGKDGASGRWNFESLPTTTAAGNAAPPPHLIQVTDGIVHIHNKVLDRSLTLTEVHASLGQLESTGQGYISLAASLPAEGKAEAGRIHLNAGLDSLDLGGGRKPSGSFHVEWDGLAWSDVAAVITANPQLVQAAGNTSGRISTTFARGAWSTEGAVEAQDVTLPETADMESVTVATMAAGFRVRQTGEEKPVELALLKITAPGVDLKAWGTAHLPPAAPPEIEAALPAYDFHVAGHLVWAPLSKGLEPVRDLTTWFDQISGSADVTGHLVGTAEGLRVTASADLLHTQAVSGQAVHKEAGRPMKVDLEARVPTGSDRAEIVRLEVTADAGHAIAKGDVPLRAAGPDLYRRLAGARIDVQASVRQAETLLATVPAMASRLAPADIHGPMSLRLTLEPQAVEGRAPSRPQAVEGRAPSRPDVAAAATTERGPPDQATTERGPPDQATTPVRAAPVWTAQLHADLTATDVSVPDGADKRPSTPATLDASVLVDAGSRQLRLLALAADLGGAKVLWDGKAQVDFPAQAAPSAHFKGDLRITKIEAALPILLPTRFDPEAASISGDAVLNLDGSAASGRLTGKMSADLTALAIRYRSDKTDYFVKPAGQAASVSVVGSWQPEFVSDERTRHHILAEADLKAPGAELRVFASGVVQADWSLEETKGDEASRRLVLHSEVLPGSTLELRASVADTARALLLAPALGQALKDQDIDGAAEAVLVLALRPRVLHVDGSVDLTGAALRLGAVPFSGILEKGTAPLAPAKGAVPVSQSRETGTAPVIINKPAGMAAKAALVIDILPPEKDTLEVSLTKADATLGESTLGAHGRVQIVRPGPVSPTTIDEALALFKEGNLSVRAEVHHSAALRRAMPCLENLLYSKADMDGPMTIGLEFDGTALRGKVHLEADGTSCAILHDGVALKPAGTMATVRLDSRYGEAPGELRIDALEMKLADSVVSADARLLFDNPRLLAMQPPSAWSVHVAGRAPDASVLASLMPSRLGDMKPSGGVTFKVAASGDPVGAELESCDFSFDRASILWLGKACALNGAISYNGERLATDGLNIVAGQSDVTLVAYVVQPDRAPTGSFIVRGKRLALNELMGLIQDSSARLAEWAAAAAAVEPAPAKGAAAQPLSEELGLRFQRLMAKARLSCEIQLDSFVFTVPDWKSTYEPTHVVGEGRLADQQLVVSHLSGAVDGGTFAAEVALDFRGKVPVLDIAYEAKDLQMQENLKPFIETTFPGMTIYGKVSQRNSNTRRLTGKAYQAGEGETVLTDGLLEGPAAPEYITRILPNLAMNQYRFNKMVSRFKDLGNGDVENQMTFYGKEYNVYIFGTSKVDGRIQYTAGVDLALSLGLKESSQPLGKLPLMYYTGRIVGSKFAELNIRYLLPHEFTYEAFVRRSMVEQLFTRKGELPPRLDAPPQAPPVAPEGKDKEP